MKLFVFVKNLSLKFKIALLLLILVILAGGVLIWAQKTGRIGAATISGQTFTDVPITHPQYLYIEAIYQAKIMGGYSDGTFRPDGTVIQEQVATVIARALAGDRGIPAATTKTYCNISRSNFPSSYNAIEYLVFKKVLLCSNPQRCCAVYSQRATPSCGTGCKFSPGINVNRALISVYLARAIAGEDSKIPAGPTTATFSDVPKTVAYYKHIEYLVKMGVVSGYPDGTFKPAENITRGQLAQFVAKGFDLISTALVANISGKVTTNTGAPLANAYLVFDEGEAIVQARDDGSFTIENLDPTLYEVEIYDSTGRLYESPDLNAHLISTIYGQQTINFTGLVPK